MITLDCKYGTAVIDPRGAQVMSYIPRGGKEVLWTTSDTFIAEAKAAGKAVRGGIPICWPWFGPHPDGVSPQHGFARTRVWESEVADGQARLYLDTDGSHPGFPHAAEVEVMVQMDARGLVVEMTTTNHDDHAFPLTQALHSYLKVDDVSRIHLRGLEGSFIRRGDSVRGVMGAKRIEGEVDDIHAPVTKPIMVHDPVAKRVISVSNHGCLDAVIWNPGADKADMPAGSYKNFVCVEAANVTDGLMLRPGKSHVLQTRISVQ